jgi:hypothetical protein
LRALIRKHLRRDDAFERDLRATGAVGDNRFRGTLEEEEADLVPG